MNLITLTLLSLVESSPLLVKRAGPGYTASGVRMTYYGSNYTPAGNGQYIGDVPPYAPYGIGACGQEPVDKNFFVAMNNGAFDGSCGYCAKVTYGGSCIVAPIVDRCPGCGSGLDVSLHAFGQLVGGQARAQEMGVATVDFEIVVCPANRASTGSPSTSNTDPCSGASSASRSSANQSGNQSGNQLVAQSDSETTTTSSRTTTTSSSTSTTTSSSLTVASSSISTASSSSTLTVTSSSTSTVTSSSTSSTTSSSTSTTTSTTSTTSNSNARTAGTTGTTATSSSSTASTTESDSPSIETGGSQATTAVSDSEIILLGVDAVVLKGPEGLPEGFGKSSASSSFVGLNIIMAFLLFVF